LKRREEKTLEEKKKRREFKIWIGTGPNPPKYPTGPRSPVFELSSPSPSLWEGRKGA